MVHYNQVESMANGFVNHFFREVKGDNCPLSSSTGISTNESGIVILLLQVKGASVSKKLIMSAIGCIYFHLFRN